MKKKLYYLINYEIKKEIYQNLKMKVKNVQFVLKKLK